MRKRTLIIIASIVVILGVAVGAWYLFFANGAKLTVDIPNPFGTSGDQTDMGASPDGGPIQGAGTVVAPRLIKITDGPVASGSIALFIPAEEALPVLASTTASSTGPAPALAPADVEVRYIERASGNVYAYRVHDRVLTRLSNKTLPGVQEAAWTADGSTAFVRFLEEASDSTEHIDTYALPADGVGGFFLDQDLSQVAVKATSTVLTLLPSTSGSFASLMAPDGTGTRNLFSSALSALTVGFLGSNYLATTKASSAMPGYSFVVDPAGSFTRMLGPLPGLSTLPSPSGNSILYSYSDRGKIYTQVLDVASRTATPLPVATLSEKCAWQPGSRALYCAVPTALSGSLPDEWYQGTRSFTDRLWKIDLDTRIATMVVDPKQLGDVSIDAIALTVDPESDVLIFTNKADHSLWAYDL